MISDNFSCHDLTSVCFAVESSQMFKIDAIVTLYGSLIVCIFFFNSFQ